MSAHLQESVVSGSLKLSSHSKPTGSLAAIKTVRIITAPTVKVDAAAITLVAKVAVCRKRERGFIADAIMWQDICMISRPCTECFRVVFAETHTGSVGPTCKQGFHTLYTVYAPYIRRNCVHTIQREIWIHSELF